MKKKAVSIFLAGAMLAASIAGCGSQDDSSSTGSGGDVTGGAAEGTESAADASGGSSSGSGDAVIDMDEDPYEVAIQVVTLPGMDFGTESDMEAAINEITLPAINCTVDIQFVWISELANTTSLAIAGNEKIDLVAVGTVQPLSSMVGSDMLYDMNTDDLLATHGSDLVGLFGDLLESGEVGGKQLAVPAKTYNVAAHGVGYNATVADELGIEVPENGTMDDLEEVLYAVKDSGKDIMPFYIGEGGSNYLYWLKGYEGFGTNCSYGAILDSSESTQIENIYASETFKEFCLRMYKWRQDGILQKDSTDSTSSQDYFNAQQLFCYGADIQPQLNSDYSATAIQGGFEYGYLQLADPVITNANVTEYMWGIASHCERPDKAMDFLNYMYVNADVANVLRFGLEGTDYTRVEGTERVVETTGSYSAGFFYGGDQSKIYVPSPAEDSIIDEWEAMTAEATVSPLTGYMFDDTDYQTESSVLSNVISQYLPTLQNGSCGSEDATLAYIDEFVAALEAGGITDVIAANQEQLDAYLGGQ